MPHLQFRPAREVEKAPQGREVGVDGSRRVAARRKLFLEVDHRLLRHRLRPREGRKLPQDPEIILPGVLAPLLLRHVCRKPLQHFVCEYALLQITSPSCSLVSDSMAVFVSELQRWRKKE